MDGQKVEKKKTCLLQQMRENGKNHRFESNNPADKFLSGGCLDSVCLFSLGNASATV